MPIPLVERSENEIAESIKNKVTDIKGVRSCREVRVKMRGKRPQIHLHLWLDATATSMDTHRIASRVEKEVIGLVPNARVTIRSEPLGSDQNVVWKLVKETAEAEPGSRGAHNIHISKINGKIGIDFHLEVSANMTVKDAHLVTQQIVKKLKTANPDIAEVVIHQESISEIMSSEATGSGTELGWYIEHVAKAFPEIKALRTPLIRRLNDHYHVVLHCAFDPEVSVESAHEVTRKLEAVVRAGFPNIERIIVHEEPA